MLLKKITTFENGTVDTDYVPLKSKITVTDPDVNGSFGERKFGYDETEVPPEGTVAVISWASGEHNPMFISKDQEAYLVGVDGKTISVIHKLPPLVVWYRRKTLIVWEKIKKNTEQSVWYLREKDAEDSEYEFLELKAGIDPNSTPTQNKETIIWMMDSKGTSKTWRPCSQIEYEMNRYNPNYGFKQCSPGEDPNQAIQSFREWLK